MPPVKPRRPSDPRDAAEKLFAPKAPESVAPQRQAAMPGAKEMVSLRLDRDVLNAFQDDGPGWQDRINAALRKSVGLD